MSKRFILASSSPYRLNLIKTLLPDIAAYAPHIDESIRQDESAQTLVGSSPVSAVGYNPYAA